ncbi:pentapeptide repeat-containing protein [Streptomyces marincola]|uniref:pentapeptide repeat-containing protein n=1 Tax=Streptomyces marincola TaxID=2878388 RepID=UPI001CF2105F|nr:pentapeptide repeat-containing protein [Streptomyces marincola]UCM88759.1 pentapeptide repeat-containing protein [Streptomyces marincola]
MAQSKQGSAVRPPRPPVFSLPETRPFEGSRLDPEGDYDGVEFAGLDLTGADAPGAHFMDCALRDCVLDEAGLKRARFVDSLLSGVRGVGTVLAEAELRDVEVRDGRFGGVQLGGATLNRVLVRGGKIDFLNLRQARLTDVAFVDCVLVEPDFGGARCERVSFDGCELRGADFHGAALREVDLRGASRLEVARGVDRLSGAVISPPQLFDLAPRLAAELGVRVME